MSDSKGVQVTLPAKNGSGTHLTDQHPTARSIRVVDAHLFVDGDGTVAIYAPEKWQKAQVLNT